MTPTIDEAAEDIRRMFHARLITRKEYGELINKLEAEFGPIGWPYTKLHPIKNYASRPTLWGECITERKS